MPTLTPVTDDTISAHLRRANARMEIDRILTEVRTYRAAGHASIGPAAARAILSTPLHMVAPVLAMAVEMLHELQQAATL